LIWKTVSEFQKWIPACMGMTEFDDIPYLKKLSMFAREMGSGGLARVASTSWVHR